jgi:iron complex transport system ATP-binding protein
MAELVFDRVSVSHSQRAVLRNVSFTLPAGALTAILGPNGAGKSTLLRTALGLMKPMQGCVTLDGVDPAHLSPIVRARRVAYLPQTRPLAWPMKVRDVVALGRFAYGAAPQRLSRTDEAAIQRALGACDLEALCDRAADTLSGGEMARMHVARAFAAEAAMILADEPGAALDPRHAFAVMQNLRAFCRAGGNALVVTHDVSLAAQTADRVLVVCEGALLADGAPKDAMTPDIMAGAFGVGVEWGAQGAIFVRAAQ